jgi:hypothetical protein
LCADEWLGALEIAVRDWVAGNAQFADHESGLLTSKTKWRVVLAGGQVRLKVRPGRGRAELASVRCAGITR